MPKVSFNNKNNIFYSVLKSEVEEYFQQKHLKKTGNWKLFLKTGILIPLAILIYIVVMAFHLPLGYVAALGGLLGLVLASIGFNIMHDACHGSYSSHKWVNDVFGLSLNMLGGNAFIWKQKHNIIHHTYTNIDGMDDDISFTSLLRLCPTKHWMPIHRLQHIYLFFIYSLTSLAWTFGTDFKKYFSRKVYTTPLSKMSSKEHFIFWTSKFLNLLIYIILPLLLKGWLFGLLFIISLHVVLGFTLAIVFQLAHVVEHTEFELAATEPKLIENEWAIHQVKTTANFAPSNKIVSWFVGGLNYQIEHHLFPRVSHIHYPALRGIVKSTCAKFNLPYNEFPTMISAIVSHLRMMKFLGKKPTLARISE
jgi:linoleoyl-CoA desaturase